jgi:hypothetical protein
VSKYINVNPDHYKLKGRDKPGKVAPMNPRAKSTEEEDRERWERTRRDEKAREEKVREEKGRSR